VQTPTCGFALRKPSLTPSCKRKNFNSYKSANENRTMCAVFL
jgi:hypothetical protein